jgi:hypothetical protein
MLLATCESIPGPGNNVSCGYNISAEAIVLNKIGCVYRDWGWSIPVDWFGFVIPVSNIAST